MNNIQEFYNILPLIIIGTEIVLSIFIEIYSKSGKSILPWFSFILFLAAGFYSLLTVEKQSIIFEGMLSTGGITNIFSVIFNIGAALVCLLSVDYTKKYGINYGEYYILIQSAVLGMMLMAGAKSLFMIFLDLRLCQFAIMFSQVLTGKKKTQLKHHLNIFCLVHLLLDF